MRWLVTGSSGFLGPSLLRRAKGRHRMLGLERTPSGEEDAAGSGFIACDLEKLPLPETVRESSPEIVVHLAAMTDAAVASESLRGRNLSRYDMGLRASEVLGFRRESLVARRMAEVPSAVPRPADVSLDCALARRLGHVARSLREGFRDWAPRSGRRRS